VVSTNFIKKNPQVDPYCIQIGNHIPKEKTILMSLENYYKTGKYATPCQIFLSNPRSLHFSVDDTDVSLSLQYIETHGISVFIHSPYVLNLSSLKKMNVKTGNFDNYPMECLIKTMQIATSLGCKGVVVHSGKYVNLDRKTAILNMYRNILECLKYVKPECPLLLETPAGQGTELLVKQTDLQSFYNHIHEKFEKSFKICVDTCHVFASGEDPIIYLKKLAPGSVGLVHFNDSKESLGSKKDRHAPIGQGCIGVEKMTEIANFCTSKNIPMVIE